MLLLCLCPQAFSIAKHRDDLELAQNYKLNTNSHQDLFYAIYQEVSDSTFYSKVDWAKYTTI